MLQTLERALTETVSVFGTNRILEPRFTRQLLLDFQSARDNTSGTPRYDITHQPELPIANDAGVVETYRRLDFRLLFLQQVGRTGDYLCLEVKYLDASDRSSDYEYVGQGVDRIVVGDYARGHPWAIMAGLERVGPIGISISNVNSRLKQRYGKKNGFKSTPSIGLPNVHESDHLQDGRPHKITIVHAFYFIVPTS